MQQLQNN